MISKIVRSLLLVLLCSSKFSHAQNLVPNYSFEDVNICTEFNQQCSPSAWFFMRIPSAQGYMAIDNVPSPTGQRHLNIKVLNRNCKGRQYWQCKLLCKLREGMRYHISIKIASPYVSPNLNDIGFYLTDSLIFSLNDSTIQPKNYISFLHAKVQKLKNNWIVLKTEFVSTCHSQFLMIGNFSDENDSIVLDKRKIPDRFVSLLVDDVVITAEDNEMCEGSQELMDSLYSVHKRHSFLKVVQSDTSKLHSVTISKIDTFVINDIQFAFDSYKLSDQGTLNYLQRHLQGTKVKEILIYGYADHSGSLAYNNELSYKRAFEVGRLITLKFGIPQSIIKVVGKGISNDFMDQRKNRRVEIYIYHE
jgi:outer membrane protein OmpA-like peptidoglycan-associated protein